MEHPPRYPLVLCAIAMLIPPPVHAQAPNPAPAASAGVARLVAQAKAASEAGRFAAALALLKESPPSASPADKKALRLATADAQYAWGQSLLDSSHAQALSHYQAALTIDRALRPADAALDLDGTAKSYIRSGQHDKVISAYQQVLRIYRRIGNKEQEAQTLLDIATAYRDFGQEKKALGFYQQARPLFKRLGDKDGETVAETNIDTIHRSHDAH